MNSKDNRQANRAIKALLGAMLAWIVPGAGHAFIGRPGRGIIIFIVIGATFWGGVAMGGVMTVDKQGQKWWFTAEILTGVHGLVGWQRSNRQLQVLNSESSTGVNEKVLAEKKLALVAPVATVARVYAGVAGLLNLMCVFDVFMLALIGPIATTKPSDTEDEQK